MQIISADDDGAGHLGGDHLASEDTTANRDLSSERALLVCNEPNPSSAS